eukprot:2391582-Rhodomonas_salina.1
MPPSQSRSPAELTQMEREESRRAVRAERKATTRRNRRIYEIIQRNRKEAVAIHARGPPGSVSQYLNGKKTSTAISLFVWALKNGVFCWAHGYEKCDDMFVKLFNSWDMARDRDSYEWLMRILHVFCMAGVVYRADGNNDNLRSIWGLVKEAGFQISIIGVLPNSGGNDRLPDNGTRNAQDKIWAKVTEIDATTTQNPLLVQRFEFQLAL